MRHAFLRMIVVAMIAVTSISCRTLPFPDPHLEGDYGKALKTWTRTVALYGGLESRAFVRIIYLSPQFLEEQAKQVSAMHAELPDAASATREKLLAENRAPTFFAIAYIPDRTANDWQSKDSVWRISLNLGYGEVTPSKVRRLDTPFNAEQRALYPYLDDYSSAYVIQFPEPHAPDATPGQPPIQFTPTEASVMIASALGKMSFHWRLDGGPETPSQGDAPQVEEKQVPVLKPQTP